MAPGGGAELAGVLLAVLAITNSPVLGSSPDNMTTPETLPALGSIPADMTTPESFVQALLDRYGSGTSLTVQELQVLLRNASSCPGLRPCGERDGATGPPGEERCNNTRLRADEVLKLHNLPNDSPLNASGLREVCPTILYTVDHTTGCRNAEENSSEETGGEEIGVGRPSPAEVWGFGILSVAVISLCSVVGVLVVPFMKEKLYTLLLTFLIALAVGALSGSALFHLIPQAFDLELEKYTEKAAAVWAGIYLFFITERLLKMASKRRQKRKARKHTEQNGHVRADVALCARKARKHTEQNGHVRADVALCAVMGRPLSHVDPLTEPPHRHGHGHVYHNPEYEGDEDESSEGIQDRKKRSCCRELCSNTDTIATVAWMVIFGDGLHNLMDGLAIGASFQVSVFSGISTSLAILCEELPHELGDFAILLNAGMSVRQAMFYNFMSACLCFMGLIIGTLVGENSHVGQWIFGLTGGMFLYISLVDMLPEMNADEDQEKDEVKKQDVSEKPSFLLRFLLQNLGLLSGFMAMLLLAKYPFEI